MQEIWKDVPQYEGFYQVSNLGRVKSFRTNKIVKGSMLNGYKINKLRDSEGNPKIIKTHQLVAMAFLGYVRTGSSKGFVVDHINEDKLDNRLENLQVITARENVVKSLKGNGTSKHVGVCWRKDSKKWRAYIHIDGKRVSLGSFTCEIEASNAYQKKLKEINATF